MIPTTDWLLFAGAALVMVLTPGPNMVYLVARTVSQGRGAGMMSLAGVIAGFGFHMLATAFGLTAMLMAVPVAYDAVRLAGAAYLLWLAWQSFSSRGASPFASVSLPAQGRLRLFTAGFLTNLLNPKIAVFYLSIFPLFVSPERGSVLAQCVLLGLTQIAVSFAVNTGIVCAAGEMSRFFRGRPRWMALQRWLTGTVLAALALRMAVDERR